MKEKIIKNLKTIYIIVSMMFIVPSIWFIIANKTVYNFNGNLEYCFLLTKNINRYEQAFWFFIISLLLIIIYYLLIKNYKVNFKNSKNIFSFILIISLLFVFVIPLFSSDVFYYLGIGRLACKYKQNPYYENIRDYINNNSINIESDTVIR